MMDAERSAANEPRERRFGLVTGAAGCIGRAVAETLSRSGYTVIGTDSEPAPAGLEVAHFFRVDLARAVTDAAYADEMLQSLRHPMHGAGLDVLVNNAAVQRLGSVSGLTRQDWADTLNVNVVAPFLLSQSLLPDLEAAGGSIVNISSIHARLTKPGFVAYATSKAALSGMTRAMAVDLGGRVRVNAIEPAAIATPMLLAGFEARAAAFAELQACHPQGRIGSPAEVAALVFALCSGELRFLHGACIGMDGGIAARLHDPV